MVKCESLWINMFRITHTGKSVNFPVTEEHRKVPWKRRKSQLRIYTFVAFLREQKKTETLRRLLAHSRFEVDNFKKKLWFCVGEGYHKIIRCRTEFPK